MIRLLIPILLVSCSCASARAAAIAPAPRQYRNTVDVGNVEEEGMLAAATRFAGLAAAGEKEVTLRIDSFGGGIFLGSKWIRAVEDIKKTFGVRVTCIVDGAAYSMGAVILESPVCDVRLATPRSTILFHNGSSGVQGNAEDIRQAAAFLEAIDTAMALQVSARIGMAYTAYRERIAHNDWMMAIPEALARNVIDGVVSSDQIDPPPPAPVTE